MKIALMNQIAETDSTFTRQGACWVGRCLICGGPLRFDALTGEGANIEHITPRALGGSNDLLNLGLTHVRCNSEKGRHWDPKRHHTNPDRRTRYAEIVARLHAERLRRWREAPTLPTDGEEAWPEADTLASAERRYRLARIPSLARRRPYE